MITPQFDYEDENFWGQVYELAVQGLSDKQIAIHLKTDNKTRFRPETFKEMIRGTYSVWNDADRQDYTMKLREVLESARERINALVRGKYLKCGLGGIAVKTTSTIRRRMKIDDQYTDDEIIQTTETISETAPNPNILRHWLVMYDKDWSRNEMDDVDDISPDNVKRGIDVASWLDKEMQEE